MFSHLLLPVFNANKIERSKYIKIKKITTTKKKKLFTLMLYVAALMWLYTSYLMTQA